jgi:hypothetical protein
MKRYIPPERRPSEITITTLSSFIKYTIDPAFGSSALEAWAPKRPSVYGIRHQ